MSIKPWKILGSTYLRPRFRIDKCEVANGTVFEPMVLEFAAWANVLALTSDNEVVLVKQYRHGVQETLLELPGGVIEYGERPIDGIKRELLEETGYSSSKIIDIGRIYPNPAIQINTLHCFLALNVEKTGIQHLDDTEEIEVHLVSLDQLIEMAKNGEFLHALHLAVLFRALAHMGRIK